jgi:hypothetical protein
MKRIIAPVILLAAAAAFTASPSLRAEEKARDAVTRTAGELTKIEGRTFTVTLRKEGRVIAEEIIKADGQTAALVDGQPGGLDDLMVGQRV